MFEWIYSKLTRRKRWGGYYRVIRQPDHNQAKYIYFLQEMQGGKWKNVQHSYDKELIMTSAKRRFKAGEWISDQNERRVEVVAE